MVAGMLSFLTIAALAAPIDAVLGDGTGPTVLALHGLGDTPASFAGVFDGMPGPARLRLLEGPFPWRGGRSWLSAEHRLAQAADRIAAGLTEAVAVVGFSQGGALALALAVRHPQRILAAVSIAGGLPEAMLPEAHVDQAPPVTAFHGGADPQAPLRPMRRVIRVLDRLEVRILGAEARRARTPEARRHEGERVEERGAERGGARTLAISSRGE